jgi:TRAP-type C4-dicarboxylate transport system substrate-binding protein
MRKDSIDRSRPLFFIGAAFAAGMMTAALVQTAAVAQADKIFVMKLSTATVGETQHEFLKRLAAAVEKDSGGRIKGEVYPASQLGSIQRQIEGVQFGSIQGWMGPPEFLVGVDVRYEALSAPGLLKDPDQAERVIADPIVRKMMFSLGADKGIEGAAMTPIAPSVIAMHKEVKTLADLKGSKIRVLASPFQLELIRRMEGSPVAMTLGDVLPALQQGTIDGALGVVTVFTPFNYQDAAKYIINNGQPYVSSMFVLSKRWMATLPPDLQQIVRDDCARLNKEIIPFMRNFLTSLTEGWKSKGGVIVEPPAAEKAALDAKLASIGSDLSKEKPGLAEAVKTAFESAARNK